MGKRLCRIVHNFDVVDFALMGAAVIGGLGGVVTVLLNSLPYWTYQASALYFFVAVSFLLLRNILLREK